jgi:hypothetical protein
MDNKFNFSFETFVNTYDEINHPKKCYNLRLNDKNEIDEIYKNNSHNYKKFINEISKYLNISDEIKNEYLNKEKYCIICNNNYLYDYESFINYYNYTNYKYLNNDMCYDCIYNKIIKCIKCNKKINVDEPYTDIYIDENYNYFCKKCIKN